MRHGAQRRRAVELVGDRAGGADAARHIRGARAVDGGGAALCAAGAELHHRPAAGGADDAVRLGGDEALVVERQQHEGLDELRLDGAGAHGDERLAREHGRTLRDRPDVAGELKIAQILQKLLAEELARAQIVDILRGEVKVFDVVDQLLQSRRDGEAALVGHGAEKRVEIGDLVRKSALEVTVAHGQLVKIAEHGHVQLSVRSHGKAFLVIRHDPCLYCPRL